MFRSRIFFFLQITKLNHGGLLRRKVPRAQNLHPFSGGKDRALQENKIKIQLSGSREGKQIENFADYTQNPGQQRWEKVRVFNNSKINLKTAIAWLKESDGCKIGTK